MPDPRLSPPSGWALVARLGRSRGLHGEIYADGSLDPDRLAEIKRLWVRSPQGDFLGDGQPFEVLEFRPYKGSLVVRLAGVDSIAAAEPLQGCEAVIPADERPALQPGEFYLSDLVGCDVFHHRSGQKLGTVSGWQQFGGPELLEVVADGLRPEDAVWIPFARAICVEIDPANRRIVVDPPEGLLDLNSARLAGPDLNARDAGPERDR